VPAMVWGGYPLLAHHPLLTMPKNLISYVRLNMGVQLGAGSRLCIIISCMETGLWVGRHRLGLMVLVHLYCTNAHLSIHGG
jgi:hypothetical protein